MAQMDEQEVHRLGVIAAVETLTHYRMAVQAIESLDMTEYAASELLRRALAPLNGNLALVRVFVMMATRAGIPLPVGVAAPHHDETYATGLVEAFSVPAAIETDNEMMCPICLGERVHENYVEVAREDALQWVSLAACGHVLHARCLADALTQGEDIEARCPMCRKHLDDVT